MAQGILTVDIVEELQQAAEAGRDIMPFVDTLASSTLPGLMEYGCARLHCRQLPDLPQSICESDLGRSLLEVRSMLGLRSAGPQKQPPRSMTPHEFEFIVVETEDDIVHRDWREFLIRFRQSANHLSMTKSNAIRTLHQQGRSQREIARAMNVDRKTVRRHLASESAGDSPPHEVADPSKGTTAPTGSDVISSSGADDAGAAQEAEAWADRVGHAGEIATQGHFGCRRSSSLIIASCQPFSLIVLRGF